MFSWQPDHFIDRPKTLRQSREWADAAQVRERVLSLIAPPGSGKTWLLRKLEAEWDDPSSGRFVIWLNVPELVNRAETRDHNRMINAAAFERWFDEAQEKARKFCPGIRPISPNPTLPARVDRLVELLYDCSLRKAPIVIVDGYDEILEEQAKAVSLRLLERLIGKKCVRMIIAHRALWTVYGDTIRRTQKRLLLHELDPLSLDFALLQFEAIFQDKYPGTPLPNPRPWMARLQHYQWDHPFINAILFDLGLQSGPSRLRGLTDQDLYDCCQTVIEHPDDHGTPRYPRLTAEEFKVLHKIAHMQKDSGEFDVEWTDTRVEEALNVNFYLDKNISKLRDLSLIVNVSETPMIYTLCKGWREFLREINIDIIKL